MLNLEPCPWCEGDYYTHVYHPGLKQYGACGACGVRGPSCDDEETAAKLWNEFATAAERARVEERERCIKEVCPRCASDEPLRFWNHHVSQNPFWVHYELERGANVGSCAADKIRKRVRREAVKGDEGAGV